MQETELDKTPNKHNMANLVSLSTAAPKFL